jgi:glycine/D-amino acid oxidase-like deaminating enzyme
VTTPVWLDEPYSPRAALEGAASADVAVLGGGVTGAAAAFLLAGRGCKVALVERDAVASGASGRNAGFLLAGVSHPYSLAVKAYGRERARLLWTLSLDNHAAVRRLVEEERIDCLYARNGSYTLALSDREFEIHRETARLLRDDGFRADLVERAGLPGSGFRGGLFNPDDGEIHPARFVRGLAAAAGRRGARIFEGTRVTRLETNPTSVTLVTPKGRLTASMLLLATNAYTPLLHPYFQDVIVGMRGQMLATEPCPERLIPAPLYADIGYEYCRQLPDGRILAGGGRRADVDRELTYAEKPSDPVQGAIERFLHEHFPAARGLRITHRWGGIMGFSCDELPSIGPVPGAVNLYAAAGYHGHGMGFAVMAARIATEMILDGKSSVPAEIFSPRRHLPD